METWLTIILACIGSAGFFSFAQFLITRRDKNKGLLEDIKKQLHKAENDSIRTQLLVLMSDYPEERRQIMMLAEYYFSELHSNWYLTGIFQTYLNKYKIPAPHWFSGASLNKE